MTYVNRRHDLSAQIDETLHRARREGNARHLLETSDFLDALDLDPKEEIVEIERAELLYFSDGFFLP